VDQQNHIDVEHKELVGTLVLIHQQRVLQYLVLYVTAGQLIHVNGPMPFRSPTAMAILSSLFVHRQHVFCAIVLLEYNCSVRLLLI
jgi:hypothetical protein